MVDGGSRIRAQDGCLEEGSQLLVSTGGGVADHLRSQSPGPPGSAGATATAPGELASESINAGSIQAANSISG
jgi:hypothetical protein